MKKEVWMWGPRFHSILDRALEQLTQAWPHLAVDGGALVRSHLPQKYIETWLAQGDADSAPKQSLDQVFPRNKDHSDLALVLKQVNAAHLRCFGFCDGRLDHHMIGLGCFYRHLKLHHNSQIRLDDNWLILSAGQWQGQFAATTVSLLPLETTRLTLTGDWHWPLQERQVCALDDLLLSNQTNGATLKLETDQPLIMWSEEPITAWWKSLS